MQSERNVVRVGVPDDSMSGARIYKGGVVGVRLQPDVDSGDIGLVRLAGAEDAVIRRVTKTEDSIVFSPESDNPAYSPVVLPSVQAAGRIIGKVLSSQFAVA